MGSIGTAKGIGGQAAQLFVDGGKVALGQYHIAVENDNIFALSTFYTIVAALARARIGLHIIMQTQAVGIFLAHMFTGHLRPIFYYHHLKAGKGLA